MASFNEISVKNLSRLIGTADCPVILDVRIEEDVQADPRRIPGALTANFNDMDVVELPQEKPVIVYCHKGLKLSQGAAAVLRTRNFSAEVLAGGHVAWTQAGLPVIDPLKLPPADVHGRSVWVTKQRPKIDRIACPWLIRRFIDPAAQFLFVQEGQVTAVAERFTATPFDIPDVFWSHRDTFCTFDTFLDEFGLRTDALDRLSQIVRGADTNRPDLCPEVSGVLAVSLGLSRMYRNDLEQVEAGMLIYDALYRWARDATDEGHDWPNKVIGRNTHG